MWLRNGYGGGGEAVGVIAAATFDCNLASVGCRTGIRRHPKGTEEGSW